MLEHDAAELATAIRRDFPSLREVATPNWRCSSASRVIDCVLSLRKSYTKVVVPRVKAFSKEHAEVRSCADLRGLIRSFPSPEEFLAEVLTLRSAKRAQMLLEVTEYLIDAQAGFEGDDEETRLRAWANWTRPGDYLMVEANGFGLAGFQYLRILFGADTVKPDVHILRYVEGVLGRPVLPARAVYILERSGQLMDTPVRSIDVALWERGSNGRLPG